MIHPVHSFNIVNAAAAIVFCLLETRGNGDPLVYPLDRVSTYHTYHFLSSHITYIGIDTNNLIQKLISLIFRCMITFFETEHTMTTKQP